MKRLFTLILFSALLFTLSAQTKEELQVVEKLYYDRDVYIASAEERAKLNDLIAQMKADSTFKIHITGYSDKWGGKEVNDRFSYVRAMYIADWMRSCRVPREQITFVGEGIDSLAINDAEARRVDISKVLEVVIEPTSQSKEEIADKVHSDVVAETEESKTETITETQPIPVKTQQDSELTPKESTPAPVIEKVAGSFSLRTNLLYWLMGNINIGVEYKKNDFGYLINGGYSPFGGADWEHSLGGWFISPEVRYYIPKNPQWFVGAQLLYGSYNLKLSDTGYQGSVVGGGVSGGYKLTLTERFDMDFNLGLGYGSYKYDTYFHAEGVNVYKAENVQKGNLLPQAGVNLIWKIK